VLLLSVMLVCSAPAAAQQMIATIPLPANTCCGVAVNPQLNRIYVSGGASAGQQVAVIDGTQPTYPVVTTVNGSDVGVDLISNRFWAGGVYSGSALVYDGATNTQVTSVGLGYCPISVHLDAANRRAWVATQCGGGNDPIFAVNADTYGVIAGPIGSGGINGPLVVNQATGVAYVCPSVSKRIDPATFTVTDNSFGCVPENAVNPIANLLYAEVPDTVQVIDGTTNTVAATVPMPDVGGPVAVNTALNRIYFTAGGAIKVVSGSSNTIIETFQLGAGISPEGMGVDSTRSLVYVAGSDGNLYVIGDPSASLVARLPGQGGWGLATDGTYFYLDGTTLAAAPCDGAAQSSSTCGWAIFRVPVAGGTPTALYPALNPGQIAVVSSQLFWIDANAGPITDTEVLAALTSGAGPIAPIYVGASVGQPIVDGSGLTTDGAKLYASDEVSGNVFVLNTDGSGLSQLNSATRWGGGFFGEQGNWILWSGGTLFDTNTGSANIGVPPQVVSLPDSGGSFAVLASGSPLVEPQGIAVANSTIYVTDTGTDTIWSLPVTGGTPTTFYSGAPLVSPGALLAFDNGLYVVDEGNGTTPGALYRINLTTVPTGTPAPPPSTPTATPTPPPCAPTGTPYCSDQCPPAPTIAPGCFFPGGGPCRENPHCASNEACVGPCEACGLPGGCCSCATFTPTTMRTPTPRGLACVVGTGTGASCTELALNACLPGGGSFTGTVTFNCGGAATITVTSTQTISADTTINGGGVITLSGGNSVGVFSVNTGVNFTVQNLTIANGNNGAGSGGGISNYGTLTVTNGTFAGNSAGADFGGGGIFSDGGTLTVTNSTFSGNSAGYYGAVEGGGGIFSTGGTVTITNSTFAGNSGGSGGGGGIGNLGGTVTITNSTFSANSGGGIDNFSGTVTVTNTIVANSTSGGNCGGAVTDGGHNIDDGTTCGFTGTGCTSTSGSSFCSTNPQFDPANLANNGGPTQTIALCTGPGAPSAGCTGVSPAINAGDESVCATATGPAPVDNLDQRGFVRPGTGAANCSIGAFEASSAPPCCQCPASCAAPINGSCGTCTVVVGAACESGDLCVLYTPTPSRTPTPITPSPTPTSTPTNTPGANDCCQCADFCAAPIVGTCGGCAVVFGASCTGGSCITQTPTPIPTSPPAPCSSIPCGGSCTIPAPCTPSPGTACPNLVEQGECQADASGTCHCVPVQSLTPTPTPRPCVGDCNGDGHVTVDEILTMVNIALGNTPVTTCEAGDANHDGQITIDEIFTAVNNALNGCTGGLATPTPPPAQCTSLPCAGNCTIFPTCTPGGGCPQYVILGTCQVLADTCTCVSSNGTPLPTPTFG